MVIFRHMTLILLASRGLDMSSSLVITCSMSSSYGITFWGYRKGSRANSNYEFVGIKHIKCYFPRKIRLQCNSDIGRQRSGSGEWLFTVPSSFHKTLGGRSHGPEVDLGKLQKEMCKEQSVSRLPIGAVHLWRCLFKVSLFLEQGCGSVTTRLEGPEFNSLLAGLLLL